MSDNYDVVPLGMRHVIEWEDWETGYNGERGLSNGWVTDMAGHSFRKGKIKGEPIEILQDADIFDFDKEYVNRYHIPELENIVNEVDRIGYPVVYYTPPYYKSGL